MRKILLVTALIVSGLMMLSMKTSSDASSFKTENGKTVFADTLSWKLLANINYLKKPSKDYPEGVMYPVINSTLKAKNHKQVVMSGFVIPIDNKTYALSKNVFASCFFCGQAGPETVMGIKMKDPSVKFKTDQYVTLKGNFRYNDTDVDDWIYHIEDAVVVKK